MAASTDAGGGKGGEDTRDGTRTGPPRALPPAPRPASAPRFRISRADGATGGAASPQAEGTRSRTGPGLQRSYLSRRRSALAVDPLTPATGVATS